MSIADPIDETASPPTLGQAARLWLKIGLISFGGPAGQIAILHEELVDRRRWISESSFLTALNFCMLLPGPEAQQLATYLGLKLHGLRGALVAGGLFILPGSIVLFALAWLAAQHGDWPPLQAAFKGMLPVVVAIVIHAVWRVGTKTARTPLAWVLASGSFLALASGAVSFPWVIIAALVVGLLADRFGIALAPFGHGCVEPQTAPASTAGAELRRAAVYTGIFLGLWAAPVGLVLLLAGPQPFTDVATFFSKAAFVTFGGAYAVLPFVADGAVTHYGWLSRPEMVHGLALAETTPGPLILVTQYVGFFAGWNAAVAGQAGGLTPLAAATVAAGLTTWVTFLPCFYFVLLGAPWIELLAANPRARAALAGVMAAVVGVIATLALTIAREAFLPTGRFDGIAVAAAAAALLLATRYKTGAFWLVCGGSAFGVLRALLA